MVTIKKIAEQSGFSQATVSRLLKGDESLSIAADTRQKIIHTALSLGYDRSKIKTTLEKIAVLFWLTEQEELQDVYFRQLRISLEKYAKINNLEIQLITHEDDVLETLQEVAGFIGIGSFTENETQQFKSVCPYGVLLEINPCPELFDTVKPDTDRMTQLAIDLFLTKGYRKIGFIGGTYLNPDTQCAEMDSREVIFRQTLARRDALDEAFLFSGGNFSVETGYRLAKKMVESLGDNLPEALFVASDTIAVGVLQALNERSIIIPDRLELISINDNEIAKFVAPPLTTFKIDVEEIAKTAIDLLVDQIVHPRAITKTVLLGAELIERKSFTQA
ncbi:LacI family transcriptional regulator [Enterococcus sp. DIV1279b]|uniref:LacI family DNA-binding transcriptional regulator n=1 Tax=Enterococcus sp. DIV1279b TaxID=2774663 RepID=UPI003D300D45